MPVPDRYRPIVKAASLSAGAIGVPGAFSFGLDVTVMSGIWTTMVLAIASESEHDIDKAFATKLVSGVLAGVAGYVGGSKIAMKLLHVIPGAGTLSAIGVNSFLNFFFTWRIGKALSTLFERGDFSMEDAGEMVGYMMTIVTPFPRPEELGEMISVVRDTSFDKPEVFQLFEQYRRR
jgi:uncharacterized protein (DUF697 family)